MKKFITLRHNPICNAGQWWIGREPEPGEMFYKARLSGGPRGILLTQESPYGIPFEMLAPFIVEHGFSIPKSSLEGPKTKPSLSNEVVAAEKFQDDNADIIEPEVQKRIEAADPSYKRSGGITIPVNFKGGKHAKPEGSK